jgi:hypothetical protein
MGSCKFVCGVAFVAALIALQGAHAQVRLPEIDVTASGILRTGPTGSGGGMVAPATEPGGTGASTSTRVPSGIGIVGTSTTVRLSRARVRPRRTCPPHPGATDRRAGAKPVQQHQRFALDGRTCAASARLRKSNVLILVDGRR